jgi:hypothetical protein
MEEKTTIASYRVREVKKREEKEGKGEKKYEGKDQMNVRQGKDWESTNLTDIENDVEARKQSHCGVRIILFKCDKM